MEINKKSEERKMKVNKLWLMFALLLVGAIFISDEVNAQDAINWTTPTQARNTIAGSINFSIATSGLNNQICNITIDIRRTYNETGWSRIATLGNGSANKTVWGLNTLYDTATSTDGNYTINATAWTGCTLVTPFISNLSVWSLAFDNTLPSTTIQSHRNQDVNNTADLTFHLTDTSVTNCTWALFYSNAWNYFDNTSTTDGATPAGTTRCTVTTTGLPKQQIQLYFLANDQSNSTRSSDIVINIQTTGGGGGAGYVVNSEGTGYIPTDSSGGASGSGGLVGSGFGSSQGGSNGVVILVIIIVIIAFAVWWFRFR